MIKKLVGFIFQCFHSLAYLDYGGFYGECDYGGCEYGECDPNLNPYQNPYPNHYPNP